MIQKSTYHLHDLLLDDALDHACRLGRDISGLTRDEHHLIHSQLDDHFNSDNFDEESVGMLSYQRLDSGPTAIYG